VAFSTSPTSASWFSSARFMACPAPYQTISGGVPAAMSVATRLAILAKPGYSMTTSMPVSFLKSALIFS
jgi:hypothetical protein